MEKKIFGRKSYAIEKKYNLPIEEIMVKLNDKLFPAKWQARILGVSPQTIFTWRKVLSLKKPKGSPHRPEPTLEELQKLAGLS